MKVTIPNGFRLGKKESNSISIVGLPFGSQAQLFLECSKCGDTIALHPTNPDRNAAVDKLSDTVAARTFKQCGWTIINFGSKHTRCPKHVNR